MSNLISVGKTKEHCFLLVNYFLQKICFSRKSTSTYYALSRAYERFNWSFIQLNNDRSNVLFLG